MSDVELKRKETLTRHELAERLTKLANALAEGGRVHLDLGATTLALDVPDHVRAEIEVEVDGTEVELELELKWSIESAQPPAEPEAKKAAPAKARRRG
jgi:amphi-Trp domain-containing protein